MTQTALLLSRGEVWKSWVLTNLKGGCTPAQVFAAMVGPQWTEADAKVAIAEAVAMLEAERTPGYVRRKIYVSVAAFCDPYLIHTIEDAVAKANRPQDLVFGVVDQLPADRKEEVKKVAGLSSLRYVYVPPHHSRGACWARNLAFSLHESEEFVLQIDSHMHFDKGWDDLMKAQYDELSKMNPKVALTVYPPGFEFNDDGTVETKPYKHTLILRPAPDNAIKDNDVRLKFHAKSSNVVAHLPACHVAGGFLFAPARFIQEVPYDPFLYFVGEEQSLALRAYTRGWDLYHPDKVALYHLYKVPNVENKNVHWHKDWESKRDFKWFDLDEQSRKRLLALTRGEDLGIYGLGQVRTLADYARYSGINYAAKTFDPDYAVGSR